MRAPAQTSRATIRGIVLDQTGARLPGVDITVLREDTNETRRGVSDAQGHFAFPELAAGSYTIEATRKGFTVFRNRAELTVGQELWLEPELTVTTTAAVTTGGAESRAPLLETNSPAMSTLIDRDQVANLPLDGRNFLELALLAPGTVPAPQGSASSVRGDFAFSTNGGREDFNNFILDGVYNVDPKLNTPAVRPPVDGIREFEVVTSTYDASFGRNAAGQVNVLTRSGANMVSGSAYEFFRDSAMAARNHFAPEDEAKPEYNRNQFGAAIGGPLARNRTFFFLDYERTRLREGITRITNVPTAQERAGNFSQSAFPPPRDPQSGQPLPGAQIPPFFINQDRRGDRQPLSAAEPRDAAGELRVVAAAERRHPPVRREGRSQRLVGAAADRPLQPDRSRVDRTVCRHRLRDDSRLRQRRLAPRPEPGGGRDVRHRPIRQRPARRLQPGQHRRVSGRREHHQRSVGLPTLSSNPRDAGLSLISIAGFSPVGHEYNNPQESTATTIQIADTATAAFGPHLFKVGGEWYGVRQSAYRDVQARGFLTFVQQGYTGNALADLLIGLPVLTGGAQLDNPQNLRASTISLFANDDWRVARPLTVSLGVRYDYSTPPHDKDDRANLYDPATGSARPGRDRQHPARRLRGRRQQLRARASASPGVSTSCSGGWSAAVTASTTTRDRWRRPRGCISTRRISTWASISRRRVCRRSRSTTRSRPTSRCSFHSRRPRINRICRPRGSSTGT